MLAVKLRSNIMIVLKANKVHELASNDKHVNVKQGNSISEIVLALNSFLLELAEEFLDQLEYARLSLIERVLVSTYTLEDRLPLTKLTLLTFNALVLGALSIRPAVIKWNTIS